MQLLLYNGVIGTADVPCLTAIFRLHEKLLRILGKTGAKCLVFRQNSGSSQTE